MRIGILTFHRAYNYGAVLQAYALLYTIKHMGFSAKLIDYWPEYHSKHYDLVDFSFFKRKVPLKKKIVYVLSIVASLIKRYPKFNKYKKFNREYLLVPTVNPLYLDGDSIVDDCDIYVYGSDQIWRHIDSSYNFDSTFWGKYPYSSSKKITYAASMGVLDVATIDKNFIIDHITNFSSISVREKHLKDFLSQLTLLPIRHVLDPVFLLDKTIWSHLSNKSSVKVNKSKYLLFYHLKESKEAINVAHSISNQLNIELVVIGRNYEKSSGYKSNIGPLDFMTLFFNASYVVSTSFHGVAFSIIFQKQFYVMGLENNAERVLSLLSMLNISDRYIYNTDDVSIEAEIDYSSVGIILESERKKSLQFLKQELESPQ